MNDYSWSAVAITLIVQAAAVLLAWIKAEARPPAEQEPVT